MLFNEPKLLKYRAASDDHSRESSFSALQRAEIAEISPSVGTGVSIDIEVSVLFNEPKLLKSVGVAGRRCELDGFSALQRAENSSMVRLAQTLRGGVGFSALQRAENSSIR